MKTAIIYYSHHHGNTKKLLDCIAPNTPVTFIDASQTSAADLSDYSLIGFASGIYYSQFHPSVLEFAKSCLPDGKAVFFLYTCGSQKERYLNSIREIVLGKSAKIQGAFGCRGLDTFGPFKLIGGIAKGRPNEEDCRKAVQFFQTVLSDLQ